MEESTSRGNPHLRNAGPRPDQQGCWGVMGGGTTVPRGGNTEHRHRPAHRTPTAPASGHLHTSPLFHHYMPRDWPGWEASPEPPRDTWVGQDWHMGALHSPDTPCSSPGQAPTNPNRRKL